MMMKFEGLDELISEFSKISSESEQEKANEKIIQQCAKVVEKRLKPKVHRSKNPKYSGLKGKKTGKHAADNIETSKVKNTKGVKFVTVGWDRAKESPYSYMQWEEWGNTTRGPHAVLYPTIDESYEEMNKVAKKEYENLLRNIK
ncbi:HK97-gp10 family putative phage morphogenesis protein [Clostridium sp.]|uniref:HK97-gp10 family putative phage morphogenesis protein n=1 Tax=Clostridium sp. TaxID=1506 RepID=UPI003993BE60